MIINTFSTFDLIIKTDMLFISIIFAYLVRRSHRRSLHPMAAKKYISSLIFRNTKGLVNSSKASIIVGSTFTFHPIIIIIVYINLASLLPFTPSLTAHLVVDIALCLPLWLRIIIWSLIFPQPSIAHYLPEGTINFIAPFLSLVEVVSSLIRPLTLSFRLAANIRAGHVIMAIAGTAISILLLTSSKLRIIVAFIGGGYFRFEIAICMVQGYVLVLLGIIYINDYLTTPPNQN